MLLKTLVIVGLASIGKSQDLTCPTGVTKPSTFYVIGASGGDIKVKISDFFLHRVENMDDFRTLVKTPRMPQLLVLRLG